MHSGQSFSEADQAEITKRLQLYVAWWPACKDMFRKSIAFLNQPSAAPREHCLGPAAELGKELKKKKEKVIGCWCVCVCVCYVLN